MHKPKNVQLSALGVNESNWAPENLSTALVSADNATPENWHSGLNFYLVKPVHYVLFGNGENRFLAIPFLTCIYLCVTFGLAWHKVETALPPSSFKIQFNLGYVCMFTMCISTIHFGSVFCRRKQLTTILLAMGTDVSQKQRDFQQHFLNVLNYMYALSLGFALFSMSWFVFVPIGESFSRQYGLALGPLFLFALFYLFLIYLIVGSIWLWIVYVMYKTFNDRVLPSLTLDTLDACEEEVISFTKALVGVSRDWKIYHILRAFAATFFGAYLAVACAQQYSALDTYTDKQARLAVEFGIVGNALIAAGYFGCLWLSIFFAGYLNDFVNRMLMGRIGNMLLNVNAHYKGPANRNKMPLVDAEKLLTNLMLILPHMKVGLEVGGLTIGVQKAVTLGTIFGYLLSLLVKSEVS